MKIKENFRKILILCFALATFVKAASATEFKAGIGQDYLLLSDDKINLTKVDNPEILTLSPFFTIFNEKNVILLHPIKEGKTNIKLFFETHDIEISISVIKNKIKNNSLKIDNLEIIELDGPPLIEEIEFFNTSTTGEN